MNIENPVCPNCGAQLVFFPFKRAACEYCGSNYLVQGIGSTFLPDSTYLKYKLVHEETSLIRMFINHVNEQSFCKLLTIISIFANQKFRNYRIRLYVQPHYSYDGFSYLERRNVFSRWKKIDDNNGIHLIPELVTKKVGGFSEAFKLHDAIRCNIKGKILNDNIKKTLSSFGFEINESIKSESCYDFGDFNFVRYEGKWTTNTHYLDAEIIITPSFFRNHSFTITYESAISRIENNAIFPAISNDVISLIERWQLDCVMIEIEINKACIVVYRYDEYGKKETPDHFFYNNYGMANIQNDDIRLGLLIAILKVILRIKDLNGTDVWDLAYDESSVDVEMLREDAIASRDTSYYDVPILGMKVYSTYRDFSVVLKHQNQLKPQYQSW